jgi:hypothetical protein
MKGLIFMRKIYIVGAEEEPEIAFLIRGDAEEYILSIAEQRAYEQYLYCSIPKNISYGKLLKNSSFGLWITEIPLSGN